MMKKYYLHKRYLLLMLFFGIATVVCMQILQAEVQSIFVWLLFLTSLTLTLLGLYYLWKDRTQQEVNFNSPWELKVDILEDTIHFPQGYYFKVSQVHTDKKVNKERITEINLNTFPPSFVVDDKEVIFVHYKSKEQLELFGLKNNIPIVERFDIWEHINQPFLDTEFDLTEKANNLKALAINGISEEETIAIRKKIKLAMWANFFAWEWAYLGQFHYLIWAKPLTLEKYAWSMQIALRNYHLKKEVPSDQN